MLRQSGRGLVFGVIAGSAAAAGVMRTAASYFFGLAWYDPATYIIAAVVLAGAASVAGWIAIGRAAPTDLSRELTGAS